VVANLDEDRRVVLILKFRPPPKFMPKSVELREPTTCLDRHQRG
jgi:hypothetical protein